MNNLFKINNKLAIVTGSSRGIGKSLALAFANSGCDLILTARSKNELKDSLEQLRALDNNININVALANKSHIGIDTEEDYLAIKKLMKYK